jgi:hypothetical protein
MRPRRTLAWHVVMASLIVVLAGCASGPARGPNDPSAEGGPVAVFTGEFVDGKPLYRLPRMEVLGWRSSIEPDT